MLTFTRRPQVQPQQAVGRGDVRKKPANRPVIEGRVAAREREKVKYAEFDGEEAPEIYGDRFLTGAEESEGNVHRKSRNLTVRAL